MIRNLFKRITAGALSALTLLTSAPLAGAVDSGIMPLAEEDNEASSIDDQCGRSIQHCGPGRAEGMVPAERSAA